MKSSSLPWPTENPRARAEWDFRPGLLPENEVGWCHEYELARIRQTQPWRSDIEKLRRESGGSTYDSFWSKAKECLRTLKRTQWPSIFYTLWPEWPLKPYLSVNPKDRKTRINDWCRDEKPDVLEQIGFQELFGKDRQTLLAARLGIIELPAKLEMEEVGDTIPGPMDEVVAFRIPGYASDRELVDMFKEWLKQRPKKPGKAPPEYLGAAAPVKLMRADLCAIGFWRLVRSGMSRKQAILYTQSISKKALFSDHPGAWTRAMQRAKELLQWSIGKGFEG